MQHKNREILAAVLLGGMIAATLDLGAASLISGRSPVSIARVIAGGLLGRTAFSGGIGTAILGVALQEFMGILIATIYVVLFKAAPGLLRRWLPSGLVYGAIIFFVMNWVVLPLSALKASAPHFTAVKFATNLAAMLIFGLIVAFFARRLSPSAPAAQAPVASPT
jgi:uncharacterized membrane protein YagU involved in acid resistance